MNLPFNDPEVIRRRATNSGFWRQSGENLARAADTLWDKVSLIIRTDPAQVSLSVERTSRANGN